MDLDHLVALESAVWEAQRAGDPAADRALLSDDFLGVYASGFADRDGHAGALAAGPTVAEYSIHDARVLAVAADHLMLSYRAVFRRVAGDVPETQWISSLWSHRGGRWLNVFSQDTPAR